MKPEVVKLRLEVGYFVQVLKMNQSHQQHFIHFKKLKKLETLLLYHSVSDSLSYIPIVFKAIRQFELHGQHTHFMLVVKSLVASIYSILSKLPIESSEYISHLDPLSMDVDI